MANKNCPNSHENFNNQNGDDEIKLSTISNGSSAPHIPNQHYPFPDCISPRVQNGQDTFMYKRYLEALDLTEEQLRRVVVILNGEMEIGLSREGHLSKTPLQMENTYVSEMLNGTEKGSYLAIDLGGTRFRVHYIEIKNNKIRAETIPYPLTKEIIHGSGKELFRYIAKCLLVFLEEKNLKSVCHTLSLGFCFSFPIIQKALDLGLLLTWTKDFKCSGVEGNDVVNMLHQALQEQNLDIKVSAILNDSTGTLIAGSLLDPNCCMSVIIGTGSNAAYLEKVENIGTWQGSRKQDNYSVIDMEWGAFGDNGVLDFLKTHYDFQVDKLSKHPGSFTFEKLFSGLYLGEVFRVILASAYRNGHLCKNLHISESGTENLTMKRDTNLAKKATDVDQLKPHLWKPWSVPTKYVSAIEEESFGEGKKDELTRFLRETGLFSYASQEDALFIQELTIMLISRAAKLIAAAIVAVLKKMNRQKSGIAIDGSMYKLVPHLDCLIRHWIEILYPEAQVNIFLSEDGSGKGAGLVAAIADRLPQNKSQHIIERIQE